MGKRRTEINQVGTRITLSSETTDITTNSEKVFFDKVK